MISARIAEENDDKPPREKPAILLGVDDADALLRDERGASLIGRILQEGGAVRIGVMLVLGDITEFENNPELVRQLLLHANGKIPCTLHGNSVLLYLNAKNGQIRSKT